MPVYKKNQIYNQQRELQRVGYGVLNQDISGQQIRNYLKPLEPITSDEAEIARGARCIKCFGKGEFLVSYDVLLLPLCIRGEWCIRLTKFIF